MKKFYIAISSILALITACVMFSVLSFAANVTETRNVLESGSKQTINLPDYNDTADYKIRVSEAGKLQLNITTFAENVGVYVCDEKGAAIKPVDEKIAIGDTLYYDLHGFNKTIWNGAMEKFSGSFFYEVEKGTYYIRFEQKSIESNGKISFKVKYPSSGKTTPDVKIEYVSFPLKKGESLQLSASLSDKTTEKVKWSTSDKSIATVSSNGKITGKSKGTATITAKIGDSKYRLYVQVIG